jgi:ketosteroid isomerase-like protein
LVAARDGGDVATALGCYEAEATVVAQPGTVLSGPDAARTAVEGFLSLRPTFTVIARDLIEHGDVALHRSKWLLEGTDAAGGPLHLDDTTADVIRRQPDGGWLVAIDNPYGTAILD